MHLVAYVATPCLRIMPGTGSSYAFDEVLLNVSDWGLVLHDREVLPFQKF